MELFKKLVSVILISTISLTSNIAGAEEGGNTQDKPIAVEPIVTNLQGSPDQYIEVDISLKVADPAVSDKIRTYMPAIRNAMILLLGSKNASQLSSTEGKQQLVRESKDAFNHLLGLTEKNGITDVLFGYFVMQ